MRFLLRDRDIKYSAESNRLVATEGAETIRSFYQSHIANFGAELQIVVLKRECLNNFFSFGLRHFDHIV